MSEQFPTPMADKLIGGYTREALVPCVDPSAPIVKCVICKRDVYTCERTEAVDGNYSCPVHPDGVELSKNGDWVCSQPCWDAACKIAEFQWRVEAQDKRLAAIDKDVEFLNKADWANDMEAGIKWRDQLIAELQQQGARLRIAVDQMESAYKLASTARDALQGQVMALRGLLERFRDRPNSRELQVEIQRVLGDGKE